MTSFSKSTILGLTFGILLAGYAVFAFTPPTALPPGGNVDAPVNVGSDAQVKSGGLWVDSLGVDGDIRWLGTLQGGDVPWGRLTSKPSTATRWPKWGEVTEKPDVVTVDPSGTSRVTSIIQTGGTTLPPSCSISNRGQEFLLQGGAGTEDGFYICKKKADGSYEWAALGSPKLTRLATLNGATGFAGGTGGVCAWKTAQTFTIPAEAHSWACSYGVTKTPTHAGGTASRIVCGEGENEKTIGPFSHRHAGFNILQPQPIAETGILTTNIGDTCKLQLFPPCVSSGGQLKLGGGCYYVEAQ